MLPGGLSRRQTIAGTAAGIAVLHVPPSALAGSMPVDWYDPYTPVAENIDTVYRTVLLPPDGPKHAAERVWTEYTTTGILKYAEWAPQFMYLWWRLETETSERIRVARIGQKMAAEIQRRTPESVLGPLYGAMFIGFEALSRGVLNSLQIVPRMMEQAKEVVERQPGFLYGLAELMLARVLFKAPPFPMSRGDLTKSMAYIELARPYAEGKFAPWYLFLAEALHLTEQASELERLLDTWESAIKPTDKFTMMNLEITRIDMANLKAALADGSYDRYLWDAYLVPMDRRIIEQRYPVVRAKYR